MRWNDARTLLLGALGWALAAPGYAQTGGAPGGPAAPPANRAPGQAAPPAGGAVAAPRPAAQPAQEGEPPLPPPKIVAGGEQKMQQLLAEWEQRSRQDQTLYAEFARIDKLADRLNPRTYDGVALLKRPSQACLEFRERVEGVEKQKGPLYERIVATGEEVYHVSAPTKQVFVYPLDPDARRRALEQGPLPFIFNFRKDDALQRYEMYLIKETPAQGDKPGTCVIEIRPRTDIDKEEFHRALVQLDLSTYLPSALQLLGPNRKDTKTFLFTKVVRNGSSPAGNPKNYDGKGMAAAFGRNGFKVVYDPEQNLQPAAGAGQPGAAAARPPQAPAAGATGGLPAPGRRR
jgi:TIGR03009 family protein